jgi:transposase
VIHPTRVAVSHEHRRAKTDRLDTELLKRSSVGGLRVEPHHCSMAMVPRAEEEDARRPNRERENLVSERSRIVNQIPSLPWHSRLQATLPKAPEQLARLLTPEGAPLLPHTMAELKRDMAHLRFIMEQIREIEAASLVRLEQHPEQADHANGPAARADHRRRRQAAVMLVHEILSRDLRDRKAVARYGGLTGGPDESGARRREKGLARAVNARVRRGMIQLA